MAGGGGVHGRGECMVGACVAGRRACMAGGVWQGCVCGVGMCMAGTHAPSPPGRYYDIGQ